MQEENPALKKKLKRLEKRTYFLTKISHFEIFRAGVRMSMKENNFFSNLFSTYEILSFDTEFSRRASMIQEKLDRLGQKVNIMDVLISGICVGHGISRVATKD